MGKFDCSRKRAETWRVQVDSKAFGDQGNPDLLTISREVVLNFERNNVYILEHNLSRLRHASNTNSNRLRAALDWGHASTPTHVWCGFFTIATPPIANGWTGTGNRALAYLVPTPDRSHSEIWEYWQQTGVEWFDDGDTNSHANSVQIALQQWLEVNKMQYGFKYVK